MKPHSRHVAIATLIVLILLLIATVAARADGLALEHWGSQWKTPDATQGGR
jgi:hypothetical protein